MSTFFCRVIAVSCYGTAGEKLKALFPKWSAMKKNRSQFQIRLSLNQFIAD
jgi:hypothetical protein